MLRDEETPTSTPLLPVTPVPLLDLDAFESSYSQRSSLSSVAGSDTSAPASQRATPLQQKQASLRTARQRQLEQRREGVAALMLLHSSLQRACAACRALQRWRRFAEAEAPGPHALPIPAAVPATLPASSCATPHSSEAKGVSPERHAALLTGLQTAAAEALAQAQSRVVYPRSPAPRPHAPARRPVSPPLSALPLAGRGACACGAPPAARRVA